MSEEQEAWEVISGELPPGMSRVTYPDPDPGHSRVMYTRDGAIVAAEDTWPEACLGAWVEFEHFTNITRQAYAEMVAPQRVREAAVKRHGGNTLGVTFTMGDGIAQFTIHRWGEVLCGSKDYDICTAALAAIRALEEVGDE